MGSIGFLAFVNSTLVEQLQFDLALILTQNYYRLYYEVNTIALIIIFSAF